MGRASRFGLAVPLVCILGWMAVFAVRTGAAGASGANAIQEMTAWGPSWSRAPASWETMHRTLEAATRADPADPNLHELNGVLYSRLDPTPEYAAEANVHFLKALELRPSSPYTWANLAAMSYRQGDTGPAFEAYLTRAVELGPFEPEVQDTVAFYGLAVWNEVAPRTRAAIDRAVAAGMRRNPGGMLQIAQRRGRLAVACSHLPGAPRQALSKWSQLCQSMEATS